MSLINDGINYKDDKFKFNWNNHDEKSIIDLKFRNKNILQTKNGNKIYYGYKWTVGHKKNNLNSLFQSAIKNLDYSVLDENQIDIFLSKTIQKFDNLYNINSFDLILTPKSSSKLLSLFINKIKNKANSNVVISTDSLIKSSFDNIIIDYDSVNKIKDEKTKNEFHKQLKKLENKEFKIREFRTTLRKYITQFIEFSNSTDKKIFNIINNNKKVLIVDDFLTDGTTIRSINNLLKDNGCTNIINYIIIGDTK